MKKIMYFMSAMVLTLMMGTSFATMQQATTDTALTTEVKTMLFEKKMMDNQTNFNPLDVHVETKDSVVTLTGHVKTEHEKMRAAEIAQSAKGVKSVDNQLVIK